MRALVLGLMVASTSAASLASPARAAADDDAVFAVLDAVGPLAGGDYDPWPVIRAVNTLQPLGKARGVALLRRYLASRADADARGGLFIVLRTVMDPPEKTGESGSDACTAMQRDVAAGGCWRPPRLGAPVPAPPADLRSLRYPAFVLGDVPLSLVSGYALGGLPERLVDHLSALAPLATWRTTPLAPLSAGEIRYLFMHYGQWSWNDEVGQLVEAQLQRYAAGPRAAPTCFDLGLVCAPRAAPTDAAIRAAVGRPGLTAFTTLEGGGKRLLFAVIDWPTDSESYLTVLGWSYTGHFKEWRLVIHQEVYGAIAASVAIDPKRAAVVVTTRNPQHPEALILPLALVPYGIAE